MGEDVARDGGGGSVPRNGASPAQGTVYGGGVSPFVRGDGVFLFAESTSIDVPAKPPTDAVLSTLVISPYKSNKVSRQLLSDKHCNRLTVSKKKQAPKKKPLPKSGRMARIISPWPGDDSTIQEQWE